MSRVCHECGYPVEETYFDVSAVVKDKEKLAFTDMSCSLCQSEVEKLKHLLTDIPAEGESLAIDGCTGTVGGLFGTVQLSAPSQNNEQYRFLNIKDAERLLKKSFKSLFNEPRWIEKDINSKWVEASWVKKS